MFLKRMHDPIFSSIKETYTTMLFETNMVNNHDKIGEKNNL